MHESSNGYEDGTLRPITERQALELMANDHPVPARSPHSITDAEHRIRSSLVPDQRVTWVRVSDLLSSGTGRLAGRGIDFEAELARRLRNPAEITRRAIRNRSASLPPLDAFGRSHSRASRDSLGRS